MGGGTIVCAVSGPRIAADLNPYLITMWKALQAGWDPPEELTEEDWRWFKALLDPEDPMTSFAGFGCSYGGSWFQAFARSGKTNIAASVARGLRKQREKIQGVRFIHAAYHDFDPEGLVVYCDPPYANTAGYKAIAGEFDSERFWETMFRWAKKNTAVLVSEFSAPDDPGIEIVWELERKVTFGKRKDGTYPTKVDYLYRVLP